MAYVHLPWETIKLLHSIACSDGILNVKYEKYLGGIVGASKRYFAEDDTVVMTPEGTGCFTFEKHMDM